ncbi:hypothetical protein Q8A73_010372 [Channa argus]|nr:hypothetical protein Q8A73_010372 [Channa argus]
MSRRLFSNESLRGLIFHPYPLLLLSCPCVSPSSPLAQDNYQPALLPKRVIEGQVIPCWALAARVRGRDPHDRSCRATTQESDWLLSKVLRMQVSITVQHGFMAHTIMSFFHPNWILFSVAQSQFSPHTTT